MSKEIKQKNKSLISSICWIPFKFASNVYERRCKCGLHLNRRQNLQTKQNSNSKQFNCEMFIDGKLGVQERQKNLNLVMLHPCLGSLLWLPKAAHMTLHGLALTLSPSSSLLLTLWLQHRWPCLCYSNAVKSFSPPSLTSYLNVLSCLPLPLCFAWMTCLFFRSQLTYGILRENLPDLLE